MGRGDWGKAFTVNGYYGKQKKTSLVENEMVFRDLCRLRKGGKTVSSALKSLNILKFSLFPFSKLKKKCLMLLIFSTANGSFLSFSRLMLSFLTFHG